MQTYMRSYDALLPALFLCRTLPQDARVFWSHQAQRNASQRCVMPHDGKWMDMPQKCFERLTTALSVVLSSTIKS
eukprot:190732-Chlamydomonas_euryale.AAC.7